MKGKTTLNTKYLMKIRHADKFPIEVDGKFMRGNYCKQEQFLEDFFEGNAQCQNQSHPRYNWNPIWHIVMYVRIGYLDVVEVSGCDGCTFDDFDIRLPHEESSKGKKPEDNPNCIILQNTYRRFMAEHLDAIDHGLSEEYVRDLQDHVFAKLKEKKLDCDEFCITDGMNIAEKLEQIQKAQLLYYGFNNEEQVQSEVLKNTPGYKYGHIKDTVRAVLVLGTGGENEEPAEPNHEPWL